MMLIHRVPVNRLENEHKAAIAASLAKWRHSLLQIFRHTKAALMAIALHKVRFTEHQISVVLKSLKAGSRAQVVGR